MILGGSGNIVTGAYSSVIGGEHNEIQGNWNTVMGNNSVVSGKYSLAAGTGTQVLVDSTFAWNGGTEGFIVSRPNFFATQSPRGMVVGSDTPHGIAILTLDGNDGGLRIQPNAPRDVSVTGCTGATI